MKPFQAPNTSGQEGGSTILDRIGDLIEESFDSLAQAVTNDVLVNAAIAVTDTVVTHGLGHPVTTWEVVRRDGPGAVYESSTVSKDPSKTIILKASAAVNTMIRFT